ncbi:hypothetical protein [Rhodococcus rhodochrous]|uniref:hypothetical protein n=1 Tax=Rhodococcus rhodochrous TaxID=1829 RepID=UPI000AB5F213|nr:hypothetical protein [Rhodococcus rhodochrous]
MPGALVRGIHQFVHAGPGHPAPLVPRVVASTVTSGKVAVVICAVGAVGAASARLRCG